MKHGPRSLTCIRVNGLAKPIGAVKAKGRLSVSGKTLSTRTAAFPPFPIDLARWEQAEYRCMDPKDGELCLVRPKSGEILMEGRSDSDVQIDRRSWV